MQSLFAIQRQSSLIAHRDKYGHLLLLSKTQCLLTDTIVVSLCYPETIESDSMQRQIRSSVPFCRRLDVFRPRLLQSPFAIKRQLCPIACRDKYGHLPPLSKTRCLLIETIRVSLFYLETIKSDNMQRQIWSSAPFVEDSMYFDRDYCSLPLQSRDKYAHLPLWSKTQCLSFETIVVSLCYPETMESDSTLRQIRTSALFFRRLNVFRPRLLQSPFAIKRQSSSIACRDKYGHLPSLSKNRCLSTETIAVSHYHPNTSMCDGMQRQIWSSAPFVEDLVSFV